MVREKSLHTGVRVVFARGKLRHTHPDPVLDRSSKLIEKVIEVSRKRCQRMLQKLKNQISMIASKDSWYPSAISDRT